MFLKRIFIILTLSISLFAKGEVSKIYAHNENATSSSYTINGHTYNWGQGKNIIIDGFEYNNHRYNYTGAYGNVVIKVRRSDNSNASGEPCELFSVRHNGSNYQFESTFPQKNGKCDMATVMGGRIISVGALDLFRNTGYSAKNIERVDFITPNGITAPANSADLAKAGHVVTEKSGNNPLKIAAILSIDTNGNPTSYGPLVGIHTGNQIDYGLTTIYFPDGSTSYSRTQTFLIDNKSGSQGYPFYNSVASEALGMAFVSLQDLGINAGQKYYGFSYFGRDVTTSMNLVNYNSFPKNTDGDTADPYGGIEGYFVDEAITPPNAMILTRGDGNDNDKTNVYAFYVDTDTDAISNFHLVKKLNKKFRSLSYHDGKFWTADMSGKLYTIDINTGNYTQDNTYGTIDSSAIMSLDFDENNNIYYNIWSNSSSEKRKLRKYNPSSGSSTIVATVSSGDKYIDDAISYLGNNKLAVSIDGGVRFIDNGNIGQASKKDGLWCVYGGEYIKDNKSYFINAVSSDLSIYKLDGTTWSKIYDYGSVSRTNGLKGMAIAVVHASNTPPPQAEKDYGDAPETGTHYNKSKYDTGHPERRNAERVTSNVYLGSAVTAEASGHFSANADGDSDDAITNTDDLIVNKDAGTYSVTVNVSNRGSGTYTHATSGATQNLDHWRYISAWIDWDNNGIYDNDEMIQGDFLGISKQFNGNKTLTWDIPAGLNSGDKKFMRIRLTECAYGHSGDAEVVSYKDCSNATNGYASFGEIEDYVVTVGGNTSQTEGICYALDDTKNKLYKVHMDPGASPLPVAQKINLHGITKDLNGEAEAYNSKDGLIYGFHEGSSYPTLYSIDPSNGQVTKIKDLTFMKTNVTGAAFYGGYFYVLAKHPDKNKLYKIDTSNWSLISQKDLYGDTDEGDGLAINENGESYIIHDNHKKIYTIDLNTAHTSYITHIVTNEDAEALSFAKDGFIYTENSENGTSNDTDKLFKIDLSTGQLTAAAQIPHLDDIDIEGLSCNTEAGSAAPVCEAGPNLIKNPSFEDGNYKNHWSGDIWKGTSYHVPDGSNYAYVDKDHGGVGYQDIPIESGKKYKLTFDAAMSTSFKGQYVSIEYLCPAHKPKNIISKTDIPNNIQPSHDFKTYTLNLPEATGDSAYIRVKFGSSNGDFVKVDNFDLRVDCDEHQRGFDITDAQLGEEEASKGEKMRFKIATNLIAPAGGIDIKYKISNKTAHAGSDFIANTATTYTAHIPEGSKEVDIFVPIIDDKKLEDAEYFTVQLQPYTGAIIPDPIALGIIIDNDMETIPPTQDGSYTINDYGLNGDILRTKIAGSSSKITIKAISGFTVLHDRQKHTAQSCSTSCSCGPCHKKTCSTTCSTYVYYTDVNSNKMNIDEVILHYQDGSTVQLSGAYSINSGSSFDLVLPTNKATKKAWITVKGHSDTLYSTGKSIELTATSDPFAIRPDRFKIEISGFNKTNPLIADNNVNMKIKAVKLDGSKVLQYSGSNFKQTITDAKYGDSLSHGLDMSSYSFSSGEISKTTSYDEVGELTIKVEEKAPYYAAIDALDNPGNYKITPATYFITVIPDKFSVSYNVADYNSANNITFFANNLTTNMFSTISYNIEAQSKTSHKLSRYDGTNGYAKNNNITVTHSINSDSSTLGNNLTIKYKDSKVDTSKTFLASSGTKLNLTLNSTDFTNGTASDIIKENFTRNKTVAKNPLILNTDKLDIKESNGIVGHLVTGTLSSTKPSHFYYGRAHAPSPQETTGTSLNAKLYYEVYCKACNKATFPLANQQASIDSVYWYILPNSVLNNFGSAICGYNSQRALISATATHPLNDETTINVTVAKAPHSDKIYYTPNQTYLQYNKFGTALPEHFFNVKFTSASSVWAGEGEKGNTVDTNISKIQNNSLEW